MVLIRESNFPCRASCCISGPPATNNIVLSDPALESSTPASRSRGASFRSMPIRRKRSRLVNRSYRVRSVTVSADTTIRLVAPPKFGGESSGRSDSSRDTGSSRASQNCSQGIEAAGRQADHHPGRGHRTAGDRRSLSGAGPGQRRGSDEDRLQAQRVESGLAVHGHGGQLPEFGGIVAGGLRLPSGPQQ